MPKTLTEKREELIEMGVSAEQLDRIQDLNVRNASKANEKGLERKEATEVAEATELDDAEPVQAHAAPTADGLTVEELAAAITQHTQAVVEPLFARIAELENQVKELSNTVQIKETADNMPPTLSLAAQLHSLREKRAVGNPATQISKEAEISGPQETDPDEYSHMTLGRMIAGRR